MVRSETVDVAEKRRSTRLADKSDAKRVQRTTSVSKPKSQPKKVKAAPMKKKTNAVTPSVKPRPKRNAKPSGAQCAQCQAYPSSPLAYAKHLWKHHKSTLNANDIYLLCVCGINIRSLTYQKHIGKCTGHKFTLHKLRAKEGPKCFKCEAFPSTAWSYAKHLGKHHKTTLMENKKYLVCACGIEFRSESYKQHAAGCDNRRFALHDLDTREDLLRERRPVRAAPARIRPSGATLPARATRATLRNYPPVVAAEVDHEVNEETDEEEEREEVEKDEEEEVENKKKEKTAEDGGEELANDGDTVATEEGEDTMEVEEKDEGAADGREEQIDEEEEEEEVESDDDTVHAAEQQMMLEEEEEEEAERVAAIEAGAVQVEGDEPIEEYVDGGYLHVDIGDVYGKYTVVHKLGWGKFSTVWLGKQAHSDNTEQSVALKIVKSAYQYAEPARIEIEMLKLVENKDPSDPHIDRIARFLDMFMINGPRGNHICIVLQPLSCNLLTLIQDQAGLGIDAAKTICRQVLEGLDYLHTKCNIIHTDIKPENILVTLENDVITQVKIGDLGNACPTDNHYHHLICTSEYRPPEVLVNIGYGTAADIWSTACLAFEVATGDYLFDLATDTQNKLEPNSAYLHLALIEDMIGVFPADVYKEGNNYQNYFTEEGRLKRESGELPCSLRKTLQETPYMWDQDDARPFSAFLNSMLSLVQEKRATAAQCLQHEWLQSDEGHAPDAAEGEEEEEEERMEDGLADNNEEPMPVAFNGNRGGEE